MARRKLGFVASLLTVVVLAASMGAPAQAEDDTSLAERASETVEAAAPASDLAEPGIIDGGQVLTRAKDTSATVPLSPDGDIVVTVAGADGSQTARIALPDEIAVGSGVVTDDGTVVYPAADGSADAVAVQTLADGSTRVQTVIADASSAHEFGYRMQGYRPYKSDTGEVVFVNAAGDFVSVDAPWAVDANGASVDTYYEIHGKELVQVVEADESTAYPIVADPSWIWYAPAWGMKLSRTETSRVRDLSAAGSMCAIFARGAPGFTVACGAFAGYMTVQANLAQSDSPRSCLFFTAAPIPGVIWRIKC